MTKCALVLILFYKLCCLICTTLKPSGKFCMGVIEGIERIECITAFTEVASQLSDNLHLFCGQPCTVFR